MWTRRAFTGFLGAGSAVLASRAYAQPVAGRRAEVTALRAFAEATHPRGREAAADAGWRHVWEDVAAEAETASDGAYFLSLWRGLSWFRDGHTTVLPFDFSGQIPDPFSHGAFARRTGLRVRCRHDGLWIVEAPASSPSLVGRRIERVNGVSAADLMRRHVESFPGEQTWAHNWAGVLFSSLGLLQGHGLVGTDLDAALRIEAVLPGADAEPFYLSCGTQEPERLIEQRGLSSQEAWAAEAGAGNYVRRLPEGAVYVSIDDMGDVEGMSFERLTADLFAAMEAPETRRIILDLRRNGGGNNFLGEPLRRGLARSRFNRPGGLYVLISPATFSAAQNLATRLERETWALFVGEPTGSSPNHFGDAEIFQGEASGFTAIVSALPWFDSYPMDRRTWIMPDLFAPMLQADWVAGRDAALDLAISHSTDAQPIEWSEARAFHFRRESQQAEWRPFWRG